MTTQKSHKKIIILGSIAAAVMFSFSFAIAPFYTLICRATGINTAVPAAEFFSSSVVKTNAGDVDLTRNVTIQFVSVNNMGLPWDFYPRVKTIKVHPGENNKVYFHVKNTTAKTMTVQAIPSITPTEATKHLHKVQCFCFNQQTLQGMETKEMPLIFNIDKDLPKEVNVITLAYTLFEVVPKATAKKE